MKCIMCLQERESSPEHIFPKAIGGRLVYHRVCKKCNPWLGNNVDQLLTEQFFVQNARIQHDLRGSRGSLPKPIAEVTLSDGSIIEFRYGGDGQLSDFHFKLERTKNGDTITFRADQNDSEELRGTVNNILREHGQPELDPEQFEATLTHSSPVTEIPVDLSHLADETGYQRAMLKIAYEVTCRWLGDAYLDDEIANSIRLAVMDETADDWPGTHQIEGQLGLSDGTEPPLNMWNGEEAHIALLVRRKERLVCFVRVFNIFHGHVLMSTNATAYPAFESMVVVNPIHDRFRESTLGAEARRFSERNRPPDDEMSDDEVYLETTDARPLLPEGRRRSQ